jgi:predicted Zn-dependent protease with MMP-like domain
MSAAMPAWWRDARPHLTDEECVEAVRDALDMLPPELAKELKGVAVIVEDRHPTEDLMGIYDPTGGLQRIVIFRETNPDRDEVIKTVLHEIGHYFGADEAKVRGWGL